MVETTAHLTDHVFPRLPMRQWVLAVPKRLRYATMKTDTVVLLRQPEGQDLLRTMLREGAQRLIAEALRAEFDEFLSQFAEQRDEHGRAARR